MYTAIGIGRVSDDNCMFVLFDSEKSEFGLESHELRTRAMKVAGKYEMVRGQSIGVHGGILKFALPPPPALATPCHRSRAAHTNSPGYAT